MKVKHVLERHYANMFFRHNRIMWLNASDILACHSKKSTGVENILIMATLDLGVWGFWISVSQQTVINNWDTRMDPLCYLSTHVFLLCDNSKLSAHTIVCHVGYIPNIYQSHPGMFPFPCWYLLWMTIMLTNQAPTGWLIFQPGSNQVMWICWKYVGCGQKIWGLEPSFDYSR